MIQFNLTKAQIAKVKELLDKAEGDFKKAKVDEKGCVMSGKETRGMVIAQIWDSGVVMANYVEHPRAELVIELYRECGK